MRHHLSADTAKARGMKALEYPREQSRSIQLPEMDRRIAAEWRWSLRSGGTAGLRGTITVQFDCSS